MTSQMINFGTYFAMTSSEHDMWQFFDPIRRNWFFLNIKKHSNQEYFIIFRNGWVVRKVHRKRHPYYFKVNDNDLIPIGTQTAYSKIQSFPNVPIILKCTEENGHMIIDAHKFHFQIDDYLKIMSFEGTRAFDGKIFIPISEFSTLQSLLLKKNILISIENNDVEQNFDDEEKIPQMEISDLLKILYSKFLKKESGIEELQLILLTKNTSNIEDKEIKNILNLIFKKQFSQFDEILYNFLTTKLVQYFDWKQMTAFSVDSDILTLLLSGTPKKFQGNWYTNELTLILPNFELLVYLQTTLSPYNQSVGELDPEKIGLRKTRLQKWRLFPYLGKLKNTGKKDEIFFEKTPHSFINSSFRTIIGIPTIEKILRDMCYLDSFNLDLQEWRGSNNLSRYFIAYVKVLQPIDDSGKIPCMIVEDFFGNIFRLSWDFETYKRNFQEISKISKNGYLSIILKNLLNNKYNSKDDIDFTTVFGISFRFITKEDFFLKNLLAIIKYIGYVDCETLRKFVSNFSEFDFDSLLLSLSNNDEILIRKNICYYKYNALTKKQFSFLLDIMEDPSLLPTREIFNERWYVLWSFMRENLSLIHPLLYSIPVNSIKQLSGDLKGVKTLFDFIIATKNFHKFQISVRSKARTNYILNTSKNTDNFQETLVGRKNEIVYINHSRSIFRNFGQSCVKSRGKWIPKAHLVANFVSRRFSFMEPRVKRVDRTVVDKGGRSFKEVEFYIEAYKLED